MPVVKLESIEDIKKWINLQKSVSSRVKRELDTWFSSNPPLFTVEGGVTESYAHRAQEKLVQVLSEYASQPTLSESNLADGLRSNSIQGATFGVSALVGMAILLPMSETLPQMSGILKQCLTMYMGELVNPQFETIKEGFKSSINIKAKTEDGIEIVDPNTEAMVTHMIEGLYEKLTEILTDLGLITWDENSPNRVILTKLGERVWRHMVDADCFIDDILTAHNLLQPKD